MKAHALIKLHERQCKVLEMIIDCSIRINEKEMELKNCTGWTSSNYASWLKDRNERNKAIKQRLISYYKDIQIRIMMLQPEIELPEREGNLLTNQFLS